MNKSKIQFEMAYLLCFISVITLLEFCEFYIVRNIDEKNVHPVAYQNGVTE